MLFLFIALVELLHSIFLFCGKSWFVAQANTGKRWRCLRGASHLLWALFCLLAALLPGSAAPVLLTGLLLGLSALAALVLSLLPA